MFIENERSEQNCPSTANFNSKATFHREGESRPDTRAKSEYGMVAYPMPKGYRQRAADLKLVIIPKRLSQLSDTQNSVRDKVDGENQRSGSQIVQGSPERLVNRQSNKSAILKIENIQNQPPCSNEELQNTVKLSGLLDLNAFQPGKEPSAMIYTKTSELDVNQEQKTIAHVSETSVPTPLNWMPTNTDDIVSNETKPKFKVN